MCKSEGNNLGIMDSEAFAIVAGIVQSDTGNVRVESHNNMDDILELPINIQINTL
jgi:septum formation topological specificity factor MinE